ncbi:hypothetical protein AeMF1_011250 [Aphanomyces euteiches]|nr:hypothetical protein AeMF1_011250 [Aphanomyces euteiches]KAH9191393.1 hypothetical protein AeNC1_006637 [Aphanomyces euteiches]
MLQDGLVKNTAAPADDDDLDVRLAMAMKRYKPKDPQRSSRGESASNRAVTSSRGMKLFDTDDLCPSAINSTCRTAVSVPPDETRRKEQQQAMEVYTRMLLGYVREQLIDEGYDMSSRRMSTFLSSLESSFLSNDATSTVDSTKLNQMLEDFRRHNRSSRGGSELGTGKSRDPEFASRRSSRSIHDTTLSIRSDVATCLLNESEPSPAVFQPIRGGINLTSAQDLDAQLAAARADYLSASFRSSEVTDSTRSSLTDSSFVSSTDDDARLAEARRRWNELQGI